MTHCSSMLAVMACAGLAIGSQTACTAAGADAEAVSRRDSAGVELVLNAAPEWRTGSAWRVDTAAAVELLAPGIDLFRVTNVVEIDGTIVVGNAGTRQILFFDSTGAFRFARGGGGSGPADLGAVAWLGACRDELVVLDSRNLRLVWWGIDGTPRRTFAWWQEGPGLRMSPRGVAPDCAIIGRFNDRHRTVEQTRVHRRPSTLARAMPEPGAAPDTVFSYLMGPGWEYFESGTVVFGDVPFGEQPFVHVVSDGILYGDGARFEYGEYAMDRTLRRIVRRVDHEPIPIPAESIAVYKRRVVDEQTGDLRAMHARAVEAVTYPDRMSAWDLTAVDRHENLWVRERRAGDPAPWAVFDTTGRWLGTVEIPHAWRLMHIGDRRLVALRRDENDVEHVLVAPLIKP